MRKKIILGVTAGLLILAISSCGLAGTSMSDRIGYFEDDLNGNRTNIIDNIHPDAASYNTLDDTYWTLDPWSEANGVFYITNITEGSSSVTGTFNSSSITDALISFEMKDDGDFFSGENWKIISCSINGAQKF